MKITSLPSSTFSAWTQSLKAGVAALALMQASVAVAQANNIGLQDIIVTARKQNESIMKVPVAATAISSSDLARNQLNDVASLSSLAPSVNFDKTSMSGGSLSIRGVGASVFALATNNRFLR